ncbi:MAG: AAA family ATPase [Rickettsiales bacterium]
MTAPTLMAATALSDNQGIFYFPHTHAAVLAKRGLFVFICDVNKQPRGNLAPQGYLSATNDLDIINAWRVPTQSTVGIACKQSRIIVFDCDVKRGVDGIAAFHAFSAQRGVDLSKCPCVRTPSGGVHYYFHLPDGFAHGNGTGVLPKGIDVRCAGYVVAPECMLPDGREYKLIGGALEQMPLLPPTLQEALKSGRDSKSKQPIHDKDFSAGAMILDSDAPLTVRESAYAAKALGNESAALASAMEGGRNNQLFKSTAALFNFVALGTLKHHEVEIAMRDACQQNGLIEKDGEAAFYKTFNSAIRAGLSTPRASLKTHDTDAPHLSETSGYAGATTYWHGQPIPEGLRKELVKGLLPKTGVGFIAGQSGTGKTFIALFLAVCAATEQPFFGHKIRERVGTLFLLGEGAGTIAERLEAIMQSELITLLKPSPSLLPIAWRSLDASFSKPSEREAVSQDIQRVSEMMLAQHGVPLGLIIVDTLAAAFAIDDENAAGEATKIMQLLQTIALRTGALVLAVTHYGKSAETGVRGSSAYTASADVILAVFTDRTTKGDVTSRSISLTKSRWRDTGWQCGFTLTRTSVGLDEDGEPIWSAYVTIDTSPNVQQRVTKKGAGTRLGLLLRIFDDTLTSCGECIYPSDNANSVAAIRCATLRAEFIKAAPADSDGKKKQHDAKRKQFDRAIGAAIDEGVLMRQNLNGEEWVWRP